MNPDRKTELIRLLVAELRKRDGNTLDIAYMHAKVTLLFTPAPSLAEVRDALDFAEEAGLIEGRPNALNVMKYAILEKGKFAEL